MTKFRSPIFTFHLLRNTQYVSGFTFVVCSLFVMGWENLAFSQSRLAMRYSAANADYREGKYQQATERYEQIAASIPNASVYYNLGNAYYRLGKRGKAILNYERAKRLTPRDRDTTFNLRIARTQNVDSFDLVKPPSGFSLLYDALHPNEIVGLGLIFCWVAALSFVAIQFSSNRRLQQMLRYVALIGSFAWLFSLLLLGLKMRDFNAQYAIVIVEEVPVRSTPDSDGATVLLIHEGTKVHIQEARPDWVKIYLPDDNTGWLPAEAIEEI